MEKEDCLLKSDSKTILESPLPMKRKLFRRFKEFNFVIEPKEKISIVGEEQAKKMGKKYCLLESDSITINDYPHKGVSTVLYRIKALKNLGLSKDESSNRSKTVLAGEIGGYVEGEHNLSQEDSAWIYDDARVYDRAKVVGNATVYDRARVFGRASIRENARVYGNAQISQDAEVFGKARVYDYARIRGRCKVYDQANVYGNAQVHEDKVFDSEDFGRITEEEAEGSTTFRWTEVFGEAQVYENAEIYGGTMVSGKSRVYGNTLLHEAELSDSAKIYGNAHVSDSKISGFAEVEGNAKFDKSEASGFCHVYGATTVEKAKLFDSSWVFDNAVVKCSEIFGSSQIFGNARVYDSKVGPNGWVFDEAYVSDSWVLESSRIFGNASVWSCVLTQESMVFGGAYIKVFDGADKPILLSAGAIVAGKAFIRNRDDVLQISNVGEDFGTLSAYKTTFDTIEITKGHFLGSAEDLKKIINASYPLGSKIKRDYEAILKMISVRFEPPDETDRDQRGEDYFGYLWEQMKEDAEKEKETLRRRDPQENNSVYRHIPSHTECWFNAEGSLVSDIESFDIKAGDDIEIIHLDKKKKKTVWEQWEEEYGT